MEIIINKSHTFELILTNNQGNFVTGQTIGYEVRNSLTDALITSGNLTEQNEVYKFSFTFTTLGQFRVKYTTPNTFPNAIESVDIVNQPIDSTDVDNIIAEINENEIKIDAIGLDITAHRNAVEDKIRNILGLTQENTQIKNTVYDSNNNLISATIRLYPTSTDALNDTNHFKEYSMTAEYDTENRMTKYVVRD